MNYNYKINGEVVRVWNWNTDYHTSVEVETSQKSYKRTIRTDKNGEKFFTWNKEKVYLKDYISYSMKELKEKIEQGEHITGDILTQSILHDGIENVRLICPLHPFSVVVPELGFGICNGREYVDTLCKITEERYEVKKNYKIGVVPVDNKNVGSENYYTRDMISLIKSGRIKIVA